MIKSLYNVQLVPPRLIDPLSLHNPGKHLLTPNNQTLWIPVLQTRQLIFTFFFLNNVKLTFVAFLEFGFGVWWFGDYFGEDFGRGVEKFSVVVEVGCDAASFYGFEDFFVLDNKIGKQQRHHQHYSHIADQMACIHFPDKLRHTNHRVQCLQQQLFIEKTEVEGEEVFVGACLAYYG